MQTKQTHQWKESTFSRVSNQLIIEELEIAHSVGCLRVVGLKNALDWCEQLEEIKGKWYVYPS